MRIGEFGGHVEAERRIPVDLFVSELHELAVSLSRDVLLQDRVDHWVDVFVEILEQEWKPEVDRHLEMLQEVAVVESFDSSHQVLPFLLLDPGHGLHLGIDTQRKRRSSCAQDPVLDGEVVGRQSLRSPLDDLHIRGEQVLQGEGVAQRELSLNLISLPLGCDESLAEVEGEGSEVGQEGRGDEAVADQVDSLLVQVFHVRLPSRLLRPEPVDELLCCCQLSRHRIRRLLEPLLLCCCLLQVVPQPLKGLAEVRKLVLHLGQVLLRLGQLSLSFPHGIAHRVDLLSHVVVVDHGIDPLEQPCSGCRDVLELRRVELGVLHVLLYLRDLLVRHRILVKLQQRAQEFPVGHHRLGTLPACVGNFLEDCDALGHSLHQNVRLCERLDLVNVLLVQIIQRLRRLLQRRQGGPQLLLCCRLLLCDLHRLNPQDLLLLSRDRLLLRRFLGVHRDGLEQLAAVSGLLLHHYSLLGQLLLHYGHVSRRLYQLFQPSIQSRHHFRVSRPTLRQLVLVGVDEVEVVLGGHVVVAT
mmetsp:Transcript_30797/g.69452  ORF Transcript_30797/g.69452 Transcript_30797/m.69452 type:complete len:525 (+) Transcript_30797:2873-4447(+)